MDQDPPVFTMSLHGDDVHYVKAGGGPVVVLIHGILGSRRSWEQLVSLLVQDFTVIAPDLLGHGDSAKPRGDYSLGGHAGRLRDLLDVLRVQRATLVGHSLGGGVAMQFAWLFPERCERLVLVSSGGLGRDVSPILRAPTLPGGRVGAAADQRALAAPRRGAARRAACPVRPAVWARSGGAVARVCQLGRRRGTARLPRHDPHRGRPGRADGQRVGAAAGAEAYPYLAGVGRPRPADPGLAWRRGAAGDSWQPAGGVRGGRTRSASERPVPVRGAAARVRRDHANAGDGPG